MLKTEPRPLSLSESAFEIVFNTVDNLTYLLPICKTWRNYALWRIAFLNNELRKNSLVIQLDNEKCIVKNLIDNRIYSGDIYIAYSHKNPYNKKRVIYSANTLLSVSTNKIKTFANCRVSFSPDSVIHILRYDQFQQLVKVCGEKESCITNLQMEKNDNKGVVVFGNKRIYLFQQNNDTDESYEVVKEYKPIQDIVFLKYQHRVFTFTFCGNICETLDFRRIKILHGITV